MQSWADSASDPRALVPRNFQSSLRDLMSTVVSKPRTASWAIIIRPSRDLSPCREVRGIGRRGATPDKDRVIRRLNHRLHLDVVEREFLKAEREVHRLGLARVKRHAGKSLEVANGLFGAGAPDLHVA